MTWAAPWPLATPRQASPRLPRRVSLLTTSRGGRGAPSCRRQSNRELRKDTFWGLRRRGKARCVIPRQAKLRLSVRRGVASLRFSVRRRGQNALFRHVAAPGRCGATPPPGCGALWRMPQLGKCARATPRQAAGRVARGFADLGLEFGLTERRTLRLRRYGKPQSATLRCDGDSLLDHCRHGQLQFNSKVSFRPPCTAAPQPTPPVFGSAYSTNPRLPKRVCSLFGSHLASALCA